MAKTRVQIKPIARMGDKVRFLWPGWVCPKYIISATVSSVKIYGTGRKRNYTYMMKWQSQQVKKIKSDGTIAQFPGYVTAGECMVNGDCIEKAGRYDRR